MRSLKVIKRTMKTALIGAGTRDRAQLVCVLCIISFITILMTVVNVCVGVGWGVWVTIAYAVMCILMTVLLVESKIRVPATEIIFVAASFLMFLYFIISGEYNGFSVLWVCLFPAYGFLVFGKKRGAIISLILFAILVFFFYTSAGGSLLQYQYTDNFKIRLPLLYMAFFGVGYLLELIRSVINNELVKAKEKYQYLSNHDALTGVYNRQGFNEIMDRLISKKRGMLSVIIIDIDYFKNINDNYGHQLGDKVLIDIARVVEVNAPNGSWVCRWGGEEFAVMFTGDVDTKAEAEKLCSKIRQNIVHLSGNLVSVTASIGAVKATSSANFTAAKIVRTADMCLYKAKEEGRNRIEYCEI